MNRQAIFFCRTGTIDGQTVSVKLIKIALFQQPFSEGLSEYPATPAQHNWESPPSKQRRYNPHNFYLSRPCTMKPDPFPMEHPRTQNRWNPVAPITSGAKSTALAMPSRHCARESPLAVILLGCGRLSSCLQNPNPTPPVVASVKQRKRTWAISSKPAATFPAKRGHHGHSPWWIEAAQFLAVYDKAGRRAPAPPDIGNFGSAVGRERSRRRSGPHPARISATIRHPLSSPHCPVSSGAFTSLPASPTRPTADLSGHRKTPTAAATLSTKFSFPAWPSIPPPHSLAARDPVFSPENRSLTTAIPNARKSRRPCRFFLTAS